jgi:hypothetical protein
VATALEKAIASSKVDPEDEPSVGWGWHGEAHKTFQIVGWFFTLFLLLYLIGNHTGRVEDFFVLGTAALLALGLISYHFQIRKSRRHRR